VRGEFFEYYRPTDAEFDAMWADAYIVIDTNVLLSLFRFKHSTSMEVLNVLEQLAEKLWMPFQIGHEFHENRFNVISAAEQAYSKIDQALDKGLSDALTHLRKLEGDYRIHPVLSVAERIEALQGFFMEQRTSIEALKKEHPPERTLAVILDRVTELYKGRVGDSLSKDEVQKLTIEGKRRYDAKIPPGYKDCDKDDSKRYGDLSIWMQIIKFASAKKRPVIFVTEDIKEDWWHRIAGKTIGPRPELRREMYQEAGVPFYMYTLTGFLELAKVRQGRGISDESIKEVGDDAVRGGLEIYDKATYGRFLVSLLQSKLDDRLDELRVISDKLDMIKATVTANISYSNFASEHPLRRFYENLLLEQAALEGAMAVAERRVSEADVELKDAYQRVAFMSGH
jgi:hypothetical protein